MPLSYGCTLVPGPLTTDNHCPRQTVCIAAFLLKKAHFEYQQESSFWISAWKLTLNISKKMFLKKLFLMVNWVGLLVGGYWERSNAVVLPSGSMVWWLVTGTGIVSTSVSGLMYILPRSVIGRSVTMFMLQVEL